MSPGANFTNFGNMGIFCTNLEIWAFFVSIGVNDVFRFFHVPLIEWYMDDLRDDILSRNSNITLLGSCHTICVY